MNEVHIMDRFRRFGRIYEDKFWRYILGGFNMSKLWDWVNEKNFSSVIKVRMFLLINCIKYGIQGLIVWMLISRFALNSYDWALCFTGYPGFFIGYIGGLIFLCRK